MKKALNESTVRKFMKLANLGSLTETFVDKTVKEEEDTLEETEEVTEGSDTLEETEEVTEELDELPPEEMGAGLDELPPEGDTLGDVPPETVEAIVDAIADALESVTGVEINVDSAGGGEEAELDAEEPGGEEDLLDTAEDALGDPAGEESLEEWDEVEEALDAADVSLEEKFNQEDFVNEVTKRVAKRLLSLSKKG